MWILASSQPTKSPFIQMRSVGSTLIALLLEMIQHCPRRPRRARVAAQVDGAHALVERLLHRRFYSRRLRFQAESVAEHERRREDHRERVGLALARDVRRGAMYGL